LAKVKAAALADRLALGADEGVAVDSGELFRAVFETTPECIKMVDPDGRILRMNSAGLGMIGAAAWEDVAGGGVLELIAPEDRDRWREHHERVCAGQTLTWEFDIIGLKGVRLHVETHAVPIRLADGRTAQLAVTQDITERKTATEALKRLNADLETTVKARTHELEATLEQLRESERSFSLLVGSVTDYALYRLDPSGRVVSWNPGAERIKGYTSDEIVGRHFSEFYTKEDREVGVPARGLQTAAREGRFEAEGWRVRKDGSRFWANVVIDAIHDRGELVGFAKITRDITERKDAEARMRQAQKMEAVGQFTGGAAHDFNNLLTAIIGSLELLGKRLPDDPRMRGLLNNAMQGATRGASLTQRMLAFARRQDLKQEAVDLCGLVEGVRELLERSIGPTAVLKIRVSPSLPRVLTDANQLETALLNLAINARDAMPGGGVITIAGRLADVQTGHPTGLPAGHYVCFSVSDTGHGMDEATLAQATEPFFTTKGVGKGTGLGLSMVDGLTAQSGGRLMARSRPGEGATIELWLPVAALSSPMQETVARPAAPETRSDRALNVLIVDDDSLVLANTAAMLEDLGHRVIDASSAVEALEIAETELDLDLVISDHAMPGMTGLQLLMRLAERRPQLPFILATGFAELPAGAEPAAVRLAKPFTQRELAAAVSAAAR
jgi:PAS domain S-box-containing protein